MATLFLVPVGVFLIVIALVDAVGTLVLPRASTGRWRLARVFHRITWAVWRAVARRLDSASRQDGFLALYAPLSLLSLLGVWLLTLMLGWAFVYFPFHEAQLAGETWFGSVFYFSGAALLTLGFGDVTATTTALRLLTLVEAAMGLGTVALMVSYLPALYGAYSRRESRLLTLDHPSGEVIDPPSLVALHAPDGDLHHLYDHFNSWELWAADVLESHAAYPVLALFRSQHLGQSWVTALGIIADAGALTAAAVPGADRRAPVLAFQRARRAIVEVAARLGLEPVHEADLDRADFDRAYTLLEGTGLELVARDRAWERFSDYRATYGGTLGRLSDFLMAPPAFWGHSAFDLAAPPGEAFERL